MTDQPDVPVDPDAWREGLLPGDIVQITDKTHRFFTAFALVEGMPRWGIKAMLVAITAEGKPAMAYDRLKPTQFGRVGPAVLIPPDVEEARRDAVETARLVEAERGA